MKDINKQRFLPELGKLLTFMVEDDRQTALALYSRLFDDAADEQQLMDILVSPTRQAVVIARTYDAKERRSQLEAARRGEPEETPAFVLTLNEIYQQVAPQQEYADEPYASPEEEPQVVNQFSLFEDDAHPIDDDEYVPFQIEAEAVPLEDEVEMLPVEPELPPEPVETEIPYEPEEIPAEEEIPEAPPVFIPAEPLPEEMEEEPAEQPEEQPAPDMEPIVLPLRPASPSPAARPAPAPTLEEEHVLNLDYMPETREKPRVFLVILYLLFAIPLTLLGVVLLLIPTVVVLALAVLVIVAGAGLLVTAFSGFASLADILIVLGVAVIVLALGLLLLWLFVWFLGGAIGGLIGGMIRLCRKWCYVEVPV